jgi:hypothetical protein
MMRATDRQRVVTCKRYYILEGTLGGLWLCVARGLCFARGLEVTLLREEELGGIAGCLARTAGDVVLVYVLPVGTPDALPRQALPARRRPPLAAGAYTRPLSAQLEPCLTHKYTLHTLNTPLTRATRSLRAAPIAYKALKLG